LNIAMSLLSRARSHPELLATTDSSGTLTYKELSQNAMQVASGFVKLLNLQKGDRVVLYMENRREYFETLYGCWIAGLVAVPINSKLHPKEVQIITSGSGAKAILTSSKLYESLANVMVDVIKKTLLISVDTEQYEKLFNCDFINCAVVKPTDLAWLFYTSGTTGAPKGAMLSHGNLLNMAFQYYADIDFIKPGETMFHVAPLSHASGLYAIPHLFCGGHQVIESEFSTDSVFDCLSRYPSVTLFAAPTMLTRLVHASKMLGNPRGNVKTVLYGGSPMYLTDLLAALNMFGNCLYQVYGQGESPMTITGLSVNDHMGDQGSAHFERLASCGLARKGVEVRIVDENGNDVSLGEPGEVITKSDTVMLGYWENEKATSLALRDGWLWTGDIGVMNKSGYVTLLDRSKDMIIRGGSNIYPREIEEVLLTHSSVLEASVVGRKHDDLGEEPVAFVVIANNKEITSEELDSLCLENIARFKRPRQYFFVESLPKNNYGKILKTELRKKLTLRG